jgi:hypothetical protein
MKSGKLSIANERVDRLVNVIEKTLLHVRKDKVLYRATSAAGIVGQIISMQAVFGSLVRLRTRELYKCRHCIEGKLEVICCFYSSSYCGA